jgi:pyridoxamine 5'-phosphate oxidase
MSKTATPCPIERFNAILTRAIKSEPDVPTAVTLATATPDGKPSARVVLLKSADRNGFVFFTNYGSRKARELDRNPYAALCFHYKTLGEQVRVEGRVERVTDEVSAAYFANRPRASQLAAIASRQSGPLGSREELVQRYEQLDREHAGAPVKRPAFWGGYRLVPTEIEFWIHRDSRLHDRWLYERDDSGDGAWRVRRLAP